MTPRILKIAALTIRKDVLKKKSKQPCEQTPKETTSTLTFKKLVEEDIEDLFSLKPNKLGHLRRDG